MPLAGSSNRMISLTRRARMMIQRTKITLWAGVLLWLLSACNFAIQSPTETPMPTDTPTATETAAPTLTASPPPTDTPVPSETPVPSQTPTATMTAPPSPTFTPTATPYPAVGLANDQYLTLDVPDVIRQGLPGSYFAVASVNERTGGTSNPETPQPAQEVSTIFLIEPNSGQAIEVLDLPASTDDRIFWSPDGKKLLYFTEPTLLPDDTLAGGLYLANLELGIGLRLFNMASLNPRGIPNHRPVWSPDSSQFAIALPTEYDVDIFVISSDGSIFRNVTQHGAFDLWPVWSPDGSRLAFISDRVTCPSWIPDEPGSCSQLEPGASDDALNDLLGGEVASAIIPQGGYLFVLDLPTESVRQITDVWIDGPPTWVSNLQIGFTTGLSDPLTTRTEIWLTSIQAGTTRRVSGDEPGLNLGAAWSPDGLRVIYHRASDPAGIVLRDQNGNQIEFIDRFLFARYGFAADWSPTGEWVTFGGRNTQCPNGLVVARNTLELFFSGTSPFACDPRYSPDGAWLAFAGIQTRTGAADGRLDLYMAQANGYGARNLTSRFQGEIRLLGWVGPANP